MPHRALPSVVPIPRVAVGFISPEALAASNFDINIGNLICINTKGCYLGTALRGSQISITLFYSCPNIFYTYLAGGTWCFLCKSILKRSPM